jgi:phage repressor protein C with HTH and peptisase S24 domain
MKVSAAATGLKRLREQAKMSVRGVADALDRPASTYAAYEDKFKKQYLPVDLAKALVPIFEPRGVPARAVLALAGIDAEHRELGKKPETTTVPNIVNDRTKGPDDLIRVLGMAECGNDGLSLWNGETVAMVLRPAQLAGVPNGYAVFIMGGSMHPRYEPGELAYIHPGKPVTPGAYVLVQMQPGPSEPMPRAFLKRLVKRSGDRVILEQFQPKKTFTLKAHEILSMHRVVGSGEA